MRLRKKRGCNQTPRQFRGWFGCGLQAQADPEIDFQDLAMRWGERKPDEVKRLLAMHNSNVDRFPGSDLCQNCGSSSPERLDSRRSNARRHASLSHLSPVWV